MGCAGAKPCVCVRSACRAQMHLFFFPLGLCFGASPEPSNHWGPTIGTNFELLYGLSAASTSSVTNSALCIGCALADRTTVWASKALGRSTQVHQGNARRLATTGASRGKLQHRDASLHYAPPLPKAPCAERCPLWGNSAQLQWCLRILKLTSPRGALC